MPGSLKDVYSERPIVSRLKELYENPRLNEIFGNLGEEYKKASIRNYLYEPGRGWYTPDLPDVPRPSMFQTDPLVVGRPQEAVLAKRILDLDPRTKRNVKSITFGPTTDSMEDMMNSNLTPDKFGETNLLGITGPTGAGIPKQIGITPVASIGDAARDWDSAKIMAHEIAHRAGWGEDNAKRIGYQLREVFGSNSKLFPTRGNK